MSEILPFICLSFTLLCSFIVWQGDWFSDAGVPLLIGNPEEKQEVDGQRESEKAKGKGGALLRLIFAPSFSCLALAFLL